MQEFFKEKLTITKNYFEKKLVSIDQFGYVYEFNFEGKEGQFKTKLGGGITAIIYGLMLWQSSI